MTEIKDWSQLESVNNDASPDGWPEAMARSGVNDTGRENMATLRRFYEAPEYLNLFDEKGDAYTIQEDSGNVEAVSDGTSDARTKCPDGSRVRLTGGGSPQFGYVTGIPTFSIETTTFVITIDDAGTVDVATDKMEVSIMRDLAGSAAYSPTGLTTGEFPPEIPTIDDLGADIQGIIDTGVIDADTLEGSDLQAVISAAESGVRNFAFNSQFKVWQRGITIDDTTDFPNDANGYCADRWKLLSGIGASQDDDMVVVSRDTSDVPDGFWSCLLMTGTGNLDTGPNAQRAGIFQVLEGRDSHALINDDVTLSYYAKVGGTVANLRVMLLKWTGDEDDTTPQPMSDWNAKADAGGPTFTGSWVKVMDSGITAVTGSWERYTLEGEDLSTHTNAKNFAIFVYTDDEDMEQFDTVRITGVQLEVGPGVTDYQGTAHATELARCQRYFCKTFDEDVAPAQNAGREGAIFSLGGDNPGHAHFMYRFPAAMREAPTIVTYNPSATNEDIWSITNAQTRIISGSATIGTQSVAWDGSGMNFGAIHAWHITAEAEL